MRTGWEQTLDGHRASVRATILDAAGRMLSSAGGPVLTMSGLAEAAGLSRATLYRYFPDTDAVLLACHDRQAEEVLRRIGDAAVSDRPAGDRLGTVLRLHARLVLEHHHSPLSAVMREGPAAARRDAVLTALVGAAVDAGDVRDDVPVDELVAFVLHALTAAAAADGPDGADRVAELTLTALRPGAVPGR